MSSGGCRGWGRSLRRAVGDWYTGKDPDRLAYLMCKYQSRDGVSNRDVLRLCHPVAPTPAHQSLFRWAVAGIGGMGPREVTRGKDGPAKVYPPACELPAIINAFEEAKRTENTHAGRQTITKLIREANLPRECIPTWALNDVDVWDALLHHSMPLAALVRNLGKMTSVGLLKPFSEASKLVVSKLGDRDYIRKSRLHPISILIALKTYAKGRGDKGSLTWDPVGGVNDALDASFYHCLVPETRVLTADLRWIPLDNIHPGQELVATDEFPGGRGCGRKMRRAVVEKRWESVAPVFRITMDDGRSLTATDKHRFLCRKRHETATEWRAVSETRVGDCIKWITHPWGESSYEDGWFGGFLDGEGTLRTDSTGARITAHQTHGSVFDAAEEYMEARGYTYKVRSLIPAQGAIGKKEIFHLSLCRMNEIFRLVGQTRPHRFLAKSWWEDRKLPGKGGGVGWSKVVSIEPAGERRVIDIQTTTGTFIAEGFVSHNSFDNVEPTGKNTCLALDVSGSMSMSGYGWGSVNCSPLSPREITAAMAMVTAKVEPNHCIVGYSHNIVLIDITKHSRLADVVAHLSSIPMGGTNCSLPFSWAAQNKLPVEVFISFTDNEVHSGIPHPTQALTRYREQMGIRAKSAIVACTATNFTIADPTDPLQMDVAGFSADTPAVLAEFAKL